jgi:uncharacterized protein with HEPN domain
MFLGVNSMEEFPSKDASDHVHALTKVGLNAIPYAGGSLATLFETIFSAPIDKRKEAWLRDLAETIDELCKQVDKLTPDKLSKNEEFISAVLEASNIAIRTHHKEKIKALKSAVKNTVLIKNYGEIKKMIFIRVIDEMTPLHFKVLHFLSTPDRYMSALSEEQGPNTTIVWGSLTQAWDEMFKDIRANDPLIDLVISDLHRFGFVSIDKFHKANTSGSSSTSMGKQFLNFIGETSQRIRIDRVSETNHDLIRWLNKPVYI